MVRRKKYYTRQYVWGSLTLGWFNELRNSNLGGPEYKVLFFLCEKMKQDDNIAYVKQKDIASKLYMDRGNVSKCIKKLREKQYIAKCENGFMINPHLFSVGQLNPLAREYILDQFDILLTAEGRVSTFELNYDDYALMKNGRPLTDEDTEEEKVEDVHSNSLSDLDDYF